MILDKNKLIYIINQIFFEKYWCTEKYSKIALVVNGCVIRKKNLWLISLCLLPAAPGLACGRVSGAAAATELAE